jgi:hypothetical protein
MYIFNQDLYVTFEEASTITKYRVSSLKKFVRTGVFGGEEDGGITFYEGQFLIAKDRLFP